MAKDKPDYVTANSAWAQLAKEIHQYDLPAMGELYRGFQVGDDPIISQTLMEVGMIRQQIAQHREKVQEYQEAMKKGNPSKLKDPGQFQVNPILARALEVFEKAKDLYSDKFMDGYSDLTVGGAVNWARANGQNFPDKLQDLFNKYTNKRVGDLKDTGDEGIVKQAVYIMAAQITQAQLLPQMICRLTDSRLEQLVNSP